jgi:hypothetical protein
MLQSTSLSNVRNTYSPILHFINSFAKEIQKLHPVAWIDGWLFILETLPSYKYYKKW